MAALQPSPSVQLCRQPSTYLGNKWDKKKKSLENTAPNEFTVHRLTCLHSKICHNATYAQFLCRWSKCHCPKHIPAQLSFRQYQLKYVQNLGQYNVFFTNTWLLMLMIRRVPVRLNWHISNSSHSPNEPIILMHDVAGKRPSRPLRPPKHGAS